MPVPQCIGTGLINQMVVLNVDKGIKSHHNPVHPPIAAKSGSASDGLGTVPP
jgi:hypothetical protein